MSAGRKAKQQLHELPSKRTSACRIVSWAAICDCRTVSLSCCCNCRDVSWAADATYTSAILNAVLALPVIGGGSLSTSYIGMCMVFVYVWLPYMILPMQAALERVPTSMLEAARDLGATRSQTFRTVILPLALPGVIAGSIFTFSLTMGDYIVPQIIGNSANFIGMAVYQLQGTAGNIPLAAAFSMVPIAIMLIYLSLAKRAGAFDAL